MSQSREKHKDELMTVDELASYLHFSKKTIYNMVKEKTLPVIRIGERMRFSRSEIDEILKRRNKKMINILVIDDTESVCNVMRRVLENEGHMVVTATSGEGGLENLAEIKFDHIFVDLYMPDMNGVDTLRHIREIDASVPITLITGRPDSMLIEQARSYGIQRVVCKPFSTGEVLSAINK